MDSFILGEGLFGQIWCMNLSKRMQGMGERSGHLKTHLLNQLHDRDQIENSGGVSENRGSRTVPCTETHAATAQTVLLG